MIGPTWFLLIIILFLAVMGLVNILSNILPANSLKYLFEKILFPTLVIGLIYIVLGA